MSSRRERGTRLCRKLATEVSERAPEGIGSWEPAWDIVAPHDAEFLRALVAWEATGAEELKPRIRAAYFSVLKAWTEAARQFEREQQGAA
jgi:hypothetical protein